MAGHSRETITDSSIVSASGLGLKEARPAPITPTFLPNVGRCEEPRRVLKGHPNTMGESILNSKCIFLFCVSHWRGILKQSLPRCCHLQSIQAWLLQKMRAHSLSADRQMRKGRLASEARRPSCPVCLPCWCCDHWMSRHQKVDPQSPAHPQRFNKGWVVREVTPEDGPECPSFL